MSHVSLDHYQLPLSNVTLVHTKKSRKRKEGSNDSKSKKESKKKGYDQVKKQKRRHERSFQKKALSGKVCAVCLDEKSLDLMLLPCAHVFHGECISKWVRNNFSCPLCRQEIAQFVPLKFAKSTMKEFEELWLQHYSSNGNKKNKEWNNLETNESDKSCLNEKEQSTIVMVENSNEMIEEEKEKKKLLSVEEQKDTLNSNCQSNSNGDLVDYVTLSVVHDCVRTNENVALTHVEQTQVFSSDLTEKAVDQLIESASVTCKTNAVKQNPSSLWSFIWSNALQMHLIVKENQKQYWNIVRDMGIGSFVIESSENANWEKLSRYNFSVGQMGNERICNSICFEQEGLTFENEEKKRKGKKEINGLLQSNKEWSEMQRSKGEKDERLIESPRKKDGSSWNQLWINSRAGACGGIAATVITLGMTNELNKNRFLGGRSLAKQTIPCVTLYFSMYEYLKQNLFHTDGENKCWKQTFAERFAAAGIAGSLVSWSTPNTSLLLGLRYASFFGSFELFKDMISQYVDHKRQLHFSEVALTAGAGGVVASTLYYPVLQLSLHSQPLQISAANHAMTFPTQIRQMVFQNVTFETLFRGFGSHLTKFLPSCVACSCAFEFSRRHFACQHSNE